MGLPWIEQRNTVSTWVSVFAVKPAITSSVFNAVFATCADIMKLELVLLTDCGVIDVEAVFSFFIFSNMYSELDKY